MPEILLVVVVIAIILAGSVMTIGSVLYFVVSLFRLFRARQRPTDRNPEAGLS